MNEKFDKNETMRLLGYTTPIMPNTPEGNAIMELLDGVGLPATSDNIMLCDYAMTLGMLYGIRKERKDRAAKHIKKVLRERPDIDNLMQYAIAHEWGKTEIKTLLNSMKKVAAAE